MKVNMYNKLDNHIHTCTYDGYHKLAVTKDSNYMIANSEGHV